MTENNDRIKKTKENIQTKKEIINEANDLKNNAKKVSESYNVIGYNIDVVTDEYGKHIEIAELCFPYVDKLNNGQWKIFEEKMEYDSWLLNHLKNINNDVKAQVATADEVSTVTDTLGSAATHISGSLPINFSGIVDNETQQEIEKIGGKPTLSDDIEEIGKKLIELFNSNIANMFNQLTKDWSMSNNNEKPGLLLSLRSIIFDQVIQPGNKYKTTFWFMKMGKDRTPKRRFAMVKFFIIGQKEETDFGPTTISTIDHESQEMADNYDNMTTLGKHGGDIINITKTYNDTISCFRRILNLRQDFF